MMNEYGTLHESNGRYALRFERFFPHNPGYVSLVITNPSYIGRKKCVLFTFNIASLVVTLAILL